MKKRILSLLLTLCLVCSLLPINALAAVPLSYTIPGTNYRVFYDITENNTVIFKTLSREFEGSFDIPEQIDGKVVTEIYDSAFYNCSKLTHITIPNTVTNIGPNAFENCTSLTSISIPNSVTSVGRGLLKNCSNLTSVDYSLSLPSIIDEAFSGCTQLTKITGIDSVTSIAGEAFRGCTSLTSFVVPESVASIGFYAFKGCNNLSNITIPRATTTISFSSFEDCTQLTIYGYKGSYAETYATKEKISFKEIGTKPEPTPVPESIRKNVQQLIADICNYGEDTTGSGKTYKVIRDTLTTDDASAKVYITYRDDINKLVFGFDIENGQAHVHTGFDFDIDTCMSSSNSISVSYTSTDMSSSFSCKAPFDISKYTENTTLVFSISGTVIGSTPSENQYNTLSDTAVKTACVCWNNLLKDKTSQQLRTIGFLMYGNHLCFDETTGTIRHTEVTDPVVPATCTTPGKTEGTHCSVCNEVITAQAAIPALGHNVTGNYLNDETGHWHKCSRCDETDTKAAHSYDTTNCGKAANCTVCGYTKSAGTHTWNAGEVIKAATCTATGTMKYTCTSCGEPKEETIPVSKHTPASAWSSDGAGHWHNCTVCNQKIDSASHTFGAWTTTQAATATTAGSRERVCTVCNYKQTETIPATGGGNQGGGSIGGGGGGIVVPPAKEDETKEEEQPTTNVAVYNDVSANAWYNDAVSFVTEKALMSGTGNNTFAPGDNLTRAMLAQILYNNEDKPATSGNSFTDVQSSAWYADAVTWATQKGIVSGYGNGQFGPNDNITREQLAVMLWRYAGQPASSTELDSFTDIDTANDYALTALRWAVEKGIISGKGSGTLDPTGNATRAEVAQMLMNYFK